MSGWDYDYRLHNPSKYNGYKAYGDDGCQIGPEVADEVLANIAKIDIFEGARTMDYEEARKQGLIQVFRQKWQKDFWMPYSRSRFIRKW